ncbi:hypothetical protein BH23GEM11_BH23GEM11_08630 [soil metagenome]
MNRLARATVAVLPLLTLGLVVPEAAEAQFHRYAAGFTAGGSHVTVLNPDAPGNALALEPGAGAMFGLHADRWYGSTGRLGLRYQAAYQQPTFDWQPGERRISALSGDVSAMLRPIAPGADNRVLPYLTAGAGGMWYDLGTGDSTSFNQAAAFHDGGSRLIPVVLLAAGLDVGIPWHWGSSPVWVRAEIADHVALNSPIRKLSDRARYGAVHHYRFSVGLHSVFRHGR